MLSVLRLQKMQKTEFIEKRIMMTIDFMPLLLLTIGNRYVTIPSDLRIIRYVQLANTNVSPTVNVYLEKKDTSYMTEYYNTPDNGVRVT